MSKKVVFNVDLIYPIGSIYMNVNDTNPSLFFGGTWERYANGRVPVGVDEEQEEFNESEKIGGSKHLQKHSHTAKIAYGANDPANGFNYGSLLASEHYTGFINATGEGDSGNLQPYITCYMWKRTA